MTKVTEAMVDVALKAFHSVGQYASEKARIKAALTAALEAQLAEASKAMELAHAVLAQSITAGHNVPGPTPEDIEKAFWALDDALTALEGDKINE